MAREMKPSGIEWIGEIPREWKLITMKRCISQRDSGAWGDEPTGNGGDTVCLRIADFDYSRFRFKDIDVDLLTKRNYSADVIEKLRLQKNDILIEKSGGGEKTPVGRTVIFDKEYCALFANFMDRLRCKEFVLPEYLQYVFVTFYKNDYTKNYIKQTTGLQNLDLTALLANESVALPPLPEQCRIADFLDRKCAEIDAVIEKTKAAVEEYKKLKQSVITEAVTKGVRGSRPMKPSGVEWIGDVPEDIKISRVGLHFDIILGKMLCPNQIDETYTLEPYYCAADVHFDGISSDERKKMWFNKEEKELYRVNDGDLLIVEGGAGAGGCCIVNNQAEQTYIQNSIMIIRKNEKSDVRYLRYLIECLVKKGYVDIVCNKATILHFTKDKVSCVPFLVFPLAEQQEISDYLDRKCAGIDNILAQKQQFVKELEAYKKSLIYEYVTGKKEVKS